MFDPNPNTFSQQLEGMYRRLNELYRRSADDSAPPPELLPLAFKELGTASEELQIALEELQQQNEELIAARARVEIEQRRYQELFQFSPDAYFVTDPDGTIREANCRAAELLNIKQQFLAGKPLSIFVFEDDRQMFRSQLKWLHQAQQRYEIAIRLCPRNGQPFAAVLTIACARNTKSELVALRICVRDMTHSQLAPAELEGNDRALSQQRLKHVYLKGEIIPLKPQTLWLVCEGLVKLSTMREKSEEVLVGIARPLMPFGFELTSLPTYQATVLSEQVKLVCFSIAEIAASSRLAQTLFPQINQRLQQTESLLAITGQRRVKDRLYWLLQFLRQEIGQPVAQGTRLTVRLTHQDLADACSTTRVTITRLLGQLQRQGKIVLDSKQHIILTESSRAQDAQPASNLGADNFIV